MEGEGRLCKDLKRVSRVREMSRGTFLAEQEWTKGKKQQQARPEDKKLRQPRNQIRGVTGDFIQPCGWCDSELCLSLYRRIWKWLEIHCSNERSPQSWKLSSVCRCCPSRALQGMLGKEDQESAQDVSTLTGTAPWLMRSKGAACLISSFLLSPKDGG